MTALFAALDATWPAARVHRAGPWDIREGQGGGRRVSSATAREDWHADDIALAEAAHTALGQQSVFQVRGGEDRLDAALEARGYALIDPVLAWSAPVAALAGDLPPLAAFAIWPPLAIMRGIWAEGGTGPARLAVMGRAAAPRAAFLARVGDRPAGVAFTAIHGGTAMLHALHVRPEFRRNGAARTMLRAAANLAAAAGARRLALMVAAANAPANALYASLGMEVVGQYHYREHPGPAAA